MNKLNTTALPSIYYISGAGRSGSTLLDIVLGCNEDHMSLGELYFFVQNGLMDNEYCSCGERVRGCPFWSSVEKEWSSVRKLSLMDFRRAQQTFLRNKTVLKNIGNYFIPSRLYKNYVHDVGKLYEILFRLSGKDVLIDSSKSPQNILILRKLGYPVKVIHLVRNFRGVLHSTKKELQKNPALGIERELKPQPFRYSFSVWLLDNLFTVLFSISLKRVRINYEDLVNSPLETIKRIFKPDLAATKKIENRGPFFPGHLVGGNAMRMSKEIMVKKTSTQEPLKLTLFQRIIISISNLFY